MTAAPGPFAAPGRFAAPSPPTPQPVLSPLTATAISSNSHVALNTITGPDGTERQVLRDNRPSGTVGQGEFGTYFIGYSRAPSVTEKMLENMFLGDPPGNYDRILDFSRAVTGTLFFVPTADFLEGPPPLRPSAA